MRANTHFLVLIVLRGYIVMYIIVPYTLNYYEDKYFISLFAHLKYKAKYIITARIP